MGVRNKISHIPSGIKFKIHLTRSAIFQEVMDVAFKCCCRRERQNVVSITFRRLLMTYCLPWDTLSIAVPTESLTPHGTSDSLPLVCSMSDDLPCFFHYTTMVLIETFLSQGTVYLLNKIDVIASKCTSNQVRTDVIPFILKHIKSESYKIQVIVASFLQ